MAATSILAVNVLRNLNTPRLWSGNPYNTSYELRRSDSLIIKTEQVANIVSLSVIIDVNYKVH